jgi:hypothetical protein
MIVPKEAITELKEIHRTLTGEMLTEAEAQEMAKELFRIFLAVYEPIPKKWLEELPHFKDLFMHET